MRGPLDRPPLRAGGPAAYADGMADASPTLRASDADRERVVDGLRTHAAAGRLEAEELAERVEAAYRAKTVGELDELTRDLPAPEAERSPARTGPSGRRNRALREHVRTCVLVNALLIAIWAFTGADYFWPVWPMLCWGFGLASHALAVRGSPRGGVHGTSR